MLKSYPQKRVPKIAQKEHFSVLSVKIVAHIIHYVTLNG